MIRVRHRRGGWEGTAVLAEPYKAHGSDFLVFLDGGDGVDLLDPLDVEVLGPARERPLAVCLEHGVVLGRDGGGI